MILGRVVGTVVCTVQHPFFERRRQLVVRFARPDGGFDGRDYRVAIDLVDAGVGDLVLMQDEGNSARQLLSAPNAPVRSVIVGVVDHATTAEHHEEERPEDEPAGYLGSGESP